MYCKLSVKAINQNHRAQTDTNIFAPVTSTAEPTSTIVKYLNHY
ncbi:11820_t:CDS:1, partial [Entrophospora sp. SA101]